MAMLKLEWPMVAMVGRPMSPVWPVVPEGVVLAMVAVGGRARGAGKSRKGPDDNGEDGYGNGDDDDGDDDDDDDDDVVCGVYVCVCFPTDGCDA